MRAGIWFVYLLAWGAFPIEYAAELYFMFIGINGPNPQFWFYLLLLPMVCILPSFFLRALKRCVF